MQSILDPRFRYTPSTETDVRRAFARIRRELRAPTAKAGAEAPRSSHTAAPVVPGTVVRGQR